MNTFTRLHLIALLINLLGVANSYANDRVALIIGNAAYQSAPLKNPCNDANAIAAAVQQREFKVFKHCNINSKQAFAQVLQNFTQHIHSNSTVLLYYSGHGIQVDGINYMIPTQSVMNYQEDAEYEGYSLQRVVQDLERAGSRLNILLLDACRNNPLPVRNRSALKGLAPMQATSGTAISFATRSGSVARDGVGNMSPYAQALEHVILNQADQQIINILNQIGHHTAELTQGKQIPEFYSTPLPPDMCLTACKKLTVTPLEPVSSVQITPTPTPPLQTPSSRPSTQSSGFIEPSMVLIKGGAYTMGCSKTDVQCTQHEKPQHNVQLKDFYLSSTEVTFAEYDHYCQSQNQQCPRDFGWGRDTRPVIDVSWEDAQAYIKWLNQQTGQRYRLPTEAEWEYAARAGSRQAFAWGKHAKGELANGNENKDWPDDGRYEQTAPVGSYPANNWELYDMLGNVWEWCQDKWHNSYQRAPSEGSAWLGKGSDRVARGGSWLSRAVDLRTSARLRQSPNTRLRNVGFRIAADAR